MSTKPMFNATRILIDAFLNQARQSYYSMYGSFKPEYGEIISWVGTMALETIANSDALYHDVEHTILVTLVGQEILKGKHMREGQVSCEDWLQCFVSLVCHDIGYVRGACQQDCPEARRYATGKDDMMVMLPIGATDASMSPYHIDRGKMFVSQRFAENALIDAHQICGNIELTRFPVPLHSDQTQKCHYAELIRAADLIGQLSDPRYLQKIPALFYEFEETGVNQQLGYKNPEDLRQEYPCFYWSTVFPHIQTALAYLKLTQTGKQVTANLHAQVFTAEHEQKMLVAV